MSLENVPDQNIFNYDEPNLTDDPESKTVYLIITTCFVFISLYLYLFYLFKYLSFIEYSPIIFCSEIPFARNSSHIETSQLICRTN